MTHNLASAAEAVAESIELLPDHSSRRMLLTAGGAAALALLVGKADAQSRPPGYEVFVSWKSPTNRLVRRITNGIDTTEVAIAKSMGYKAYLEKQLNPETINDSDTDKVMAGRWPKMAWTEAQLMDDTDQYNQYQQLLHSTIYRAIYSRKMLYERMVEFWTDHFNVDAKKSGVPLMTTFIQKNIRRHAMGKFGDLLKSTAHSAAMLRYLDNDHNASYAPNINYARELLELHTVGTSGGYTADDLHDTAEILSGWKWTSDSRNYNRGRFKFDVDYHAGGDKSVLGTTYEESGQPEGEALLNNLGTCPQTARFITKKLIRWFLGDPVPTDVWNAAQATFMSTGGDIRSVLRVILAEKNVVNSPPRFKRPSHLLYSALRGAKSRAYQFTAIVYGPLYDSGMVPFSWPTPDGFPDKYEFWAPAQMPRLNIAFKIAGNYIMDVVTDVPKMFGADRTPKGCTDAIANALFGGEMSSADRDALFAYFSKSSIDDTRLKGGLMLAIACPSFQWY